MAKVTAEEAALVLQDEQRKRIKAFQMEYEILCKKHECEIQGIPGFTNDGRIGVQLQVTMKVNGPEIG